MPRVEKRLGGVFYGNPAWRVENGDVVSVRATADEDLLAIKRVLLALRADDVDEGGFVGEAGLGVLRRLALIGALRAGLA